MEGNDSTSTARQKQVGGRWKKNTFCIHVADCGMTEFGPTLLTDHEGVGEKNLLSMPVAPDLYGKCCSHNNMARDRHYA